MRHALSLSEVRTRWAKELVRQFVGPNAKVCWIHRSNKCSVTLDLFMSFVVQDCHGVVCHIRFGFMTCSVILDLFSRCS